MLVLQKCEELLEEFERNWRAARRVSCLMYIYINYNYFQRSRQRRGRPSMIKTEIDIKEPNFYLKSECPDTNLSSPLFKPNIGRESQEYPLTTSNFNNFNLIEIPPDIPIKVNEFPCCIHSPPISEIPDLTVKAVSIEGLYLYNGDIATCIKTDQGEIAFVNLKALGKQNLDLVMDFILNSIYIKFI